MDPELFFSRLAAETDPLDPAGERAPARLTSRIYSALVSAQASTGPLLSVSATKASGRPLCVFERVVDAAPVGDGLKSLNPCRVCHARYLAERLERAPIYWPHCPYAAFHRR